MTLSRPILIALPFLLILLIAAAPALLRQPPTPEVTTEEGRCFELRTYTAHPGKLDALLTRFRDHTTAIFNRVGMTNVGYWLPNENEKNQLVYLLAYPSCEAREASWEAFLEDPDWKAAYKASIADGPLVEHIDSVVMTAADFSAMK